MFATDSITLATIFWNTWYLEDIFSVLISDNEFTTKSATCKDKISTKKCKKLKKKGKCEDKKTYKKCMETCQRCTPGNIELHQLLA